MVVVVVVLLTMYIIYHAPFRTFSHRAVSPKYVHAKKAVRRDTHMPMAALRFFFTTVAGSLKMVPHNIIA